MSEKKLKPCPFCGEKEEIKMDLSMHGVCYYCLECWAESRRGENSQHAAEYWNSRPIEDALRARIKELEAIKAEQDYVIKQCATWVSGENGCPKCENPNFPCEEEDCWNKDEDNTGLDFEPKYCENEDGCWVKYYRWKYKQKFEKKAGE